MVMLIRVLPVGVMGIGDKREQNLARGGNGGRRGEGVRGGQG